jgi:YggT family protein
MELLLLSQVSRFISKKNDSYFLFSFTNFKTYSYVVIANVLISWLIAFNVLNTQNRFVYSILELTYRLTDPILYRIRRFLPNLGSLDISPIILLLLIWFIEMCMKLYIAPMIF